MMQEPTQATIDALIAELPPARQQTAKRLLTKLHEENPAAALIFELTLLKLAEMQTAREPRTTPQPTLPDITPLASGIEAAKQAIVGEIIGVQKSLGKLSRVAEDAAHMRTVTDRIESKLDVLRPYRAKVAVITLLVTMATGMVAGWYGHIEYAQYRYENRMQRR